HRHLTTYLTSHSRNPSLDFTSSLYSDSLRTCSLTGDDLASLSDVEAALPDTLFTYSHPLPHLAPSRPTAKPLPHTAISLYSPPPQLKITPVSPSTSSPPRSTSKSGLKSRPLSYPPTTKIASTITTALARNLDPNTNQPLPSPSKADKKIWWKGIQSPRATKEESDQPPTPYKNFLKGLERKSWFSSSSSNTTSPTHQPTEEVPSRVSTSKKTDLDNTSSKRSSWSFFPINRRASWLQTEAVDPSRPTPTKRQTEKNRHPVVRNTNQDKYQDKERRFSFLVIEEQHQRQEEEVRLVKALTPILEQEA
ncbi:hypothetical protein BGZ92_005401, partial [Podila epicladia]